MTSQEIRQSFIDFFKKRGHTHMPPSSLVPKGDPSVLFTTAGMQQFKDYYLRPELASSPRVCTIQSSFRTSDIEEVGDDRHLTIFEMLGNFSFGYQEGEAQDKSSPTPYFKQVAIELAYEYIINQLKIDLSRVYVTVYEGSKDWQIPQDEESAKIWNNLGIRDIRYEGDNNFWGPTGSEGPCGPTTEIYVDDVEVWNLVFNEFYSDNNKQLTPLTYKGVDTGAGLERLAIVMQNKREVFETDLFTSVIEKIRSLSNHDRYTEKSARIIADHLKAAMFLIADGVRPSNKTQGYILRRLIRRLMVNAQGIDLPSENIYEILETHYGIYVKDYNRLAAEYGMINLVLKDEISRFTKTLEKGMKEFEKILKENKQGREIPIDQAFKLFDTYGFPIELTKELAEKEGYKLDMKTFEERFKSHQEISRAGLEKVFKGGLADTELQTIKHHTAHHLLLTALRKVLGERVHQKGSNVTSDRLRIDFSHPQKLTDGQIKKVEDTVNEAIKADLEVKREEMSREEAEQLGALAEFGAKYGDKVSVYTIMSKDGSFFSRELCGGPHVKRTGELGKFKILKEEASSAGIRRIKARLE